MPEALILPRTSAAVAALIQRRKSSSSSVDLGAGILFPDENFPDHLTHVISSDDPLVGLSCATLRRLSITSGSWALVTNLETNARRAAKVLALDPPLDDSDGDSAPGASSLPNFFPTCRFSGKLQCIFSSNVAYVSPVLAFNLGFHHQWIESLVVAGNSNESPFGFDRVAGLKVRVEALEPGKLKVASHVRISFVKIPAAMMEFCSTLLSEKRQDEIDEGLRVHFNGGGIVGAGDLLSLTLNSSTVSDFYQRFHFAGRDDNVVRFKVISIEPAAEELVLVDNARTALVLSGSVPSQLPPLVLKQTPLQCSSLHTPAVRELVSLAAPWLHPRMVSLRISTLLLGPAGVGKRSIVRLVADALGIHVVEYNCYELLGATENKASLALENAFKVASSYSPAILLLRRLGALGESASRNSNQSGGSRLAAALKNFISTYSRRNVLEQHMDDPEGFEDDHVDESARPEKTQSSVMLIATADEEESVKTLRHCFTHEIPMSSPDESQRFELLKSFLKADKYPDILEDLERGLKNISSQTAGLLPRDLKSVAADVGAFALEDDSIQSSEANTCTKNSITAESLDKALEQVKKRTASAIGTPKVPNVKWEDIGGLENVKRAILDTVQLPLLHRELFTAGLKQRSGLLLYGPPGTGKTLLAKAVATECSLNFLSVKGPELINMFIGESEKNVREIFQKARGARPCIVFFDELDALAPARGASGDSGGVMDRVVSQMLAEIDGLGDGSQDLFVIGATNRPDLIDSALLRPGRFDKLLYVGISADPSYRFKVLSALTRKFDLDEDVSLNFIARRCSDNFTGADLYALCADAWMQAVKRKASGAEEDEARVVVKHEDFMHALVELKPSLSLSELAKYERLRLQFQGLA